MRDGRDVPYSAKEPARPGKDGDRMKEEVSPGSARSVLGYRCQAVDLWDGSGSVQRIVLYLKTATAASVSPKRLNDCGSQNLFHADQ